MKKTFYLVIVTLIIQYIFIACENKPARNQEMISLLSLMAKKEHSSKNPFCPEAKMEQYDSLLKAASTPGDLLGVKYAMAKTYLELGDEAKAVAIGEDLLQHITYSQNSHKQTIMKDLAMSYLRLGERTNCINYHPGESCTFPIAGRGVHADKSGSNRAIELYKEILLDDPDDLESKWLLNVAYMTTGGYPQQVPAAFLIPGLDADTSHLVKPFLDVSVGMGLSTKNMAGGSIVDDLNNDGYLDVVTSSWGLQDGMHYCRNNTNGTFTDVSAASGLKYLTGGLNITQTDYNNDGLKDIFVLRGAWKAAYGDDPNSLLKNNGDGTFTDVTKESGLLSFHPTQTATWADFNNDGWLDVFIGNESSLSNSSNPCEFYLNNKNGTFTDVAEKAGCNVIAYVKGVTSGDYNNDGLPDIFISTLNGHKILLKNEGIKNGNIHFENVTEQAGLGNNQTGTFPTWFFDYDNDGWLDILVCGYQVNTSLSWFAAAEALKLPVGNSGSIFLYHNNHNGTFEDVSEKAGLNKTAFAMGANFGDIDNDGYLDFYLGTGNPLYQSLVPNKLFKNIGGHNFIDVTNAARVGNLQKGHGVSFADMDNDGDEDIYIKMGGAYPGDGYYSALYLNPGQNNNNWINISLTGTRANKIAIGAKITVTFKEKGVSRSVCRDVNSGGSFGSNPLTQHIGIGEATVIERIEIKWPGSQEVQVFTNIQARENIKITEGNNSITTVTLGKADFTGRKVGIISCYPK